MAERVIRIAIDSAPAEAGARRVVRSLDAIARKGREAAEAGDRLLEAMPNLQAVQDEVLRNGREVGEGAKRVFADYADAATDAGAQIERAIGGALNGLEDTLVGFVQTGKLEWKSLVDAMIADLIRLFVRSQILGPLAQALGDAFGAGSLGPQFTGTDFAGLQAAGSFRHGGAFTVGGSGGPDSRLVAFRATPGERVTVMPSGRGAPESGAVINVKVINQAGAEVETREQPNDQGGLDLLVLVRRDVEQDILSGGRIGRAIGQTFGAGVRPVGR